MIRGIIVTHGSVGREMLDSAERVLGPQPEMEVLTNEGKSLEQIMAEVDARAGAAPCVLFVDFCGGSPYVACKMLHDLQPGRAVLSGVNLPMLFSFFTKREQLEFAALVEMVESDAHRGIKRLSE